MTVYVDELVPYQFGPGDWRNGEWCHLWTDGDVAELHAFAETIGLKRAWLHVSPSAFLGRPFEHYDLRPARRQCALDQGAKAISLMDYLRPFVVQARKAQSEVTSS